MEGIKLLQ